MKLFFALLFRNRLAALGGVVLTAIVILALLAPVLPLQAPDVTHMGSRYLLPLSAGHWLGTDGLGRDLLSRLIWGTRLSLGVGLIAALGAGILGSAVGIVAGYFGGRTDNVIMRLVDMIMGFPY
ncbi:peptide ABC transporter permease, partial [Thioclava sp. BHET1]